MNKTMNTNLPAMLPDFCTEIAQLVRSHLTPGKMREKLGAYHEKDIALVLPMLNREECQRMFCVLSPRDIAAVLEYAQNNADYFEYLGFRQRGEVLSCMEVSVGAELLKHLSREERTSLLEWVSPEIRREINLICSFDADEIGSRMSTNYIAIPDTSTVKQAMSELVRQAAENDNISTLYLVDQNHIFCGAIDLKDLIIAREDTPLSEITTLSYPYLYARLAIEDCLSFFTDYSESSIPVLDDENRLIGVVTAQDFMEILDAELGDDYAKLAGLASEEDLAEPVSQSVKKRLPWLCILLVMGLGVSATVGLFESIVAQLPVIMCLSLIHI